MYERSNNNSISSAKTGHSARVYCSRLSLCSPPFHDSSSSSAPARCVLAGRRVLTRTTQDSLSLRTARCVCIKQFCFLLFVKAIKFDNNNNGGTFLLLLLLPFDSFFLLSIFIQFFLHLSFAFHYFTSWAITHNMFSNFIPPSVFWKRSDCRLRCDGTKIVSSELRNELKW